MCMFKQVKNFFWGGGEGGLVSNLATGNFYRQLRWLIATKFFFFYVGKTYFITGDAKPRYEKAT